MYFFNFDRLLGHSTATEILQLTSSLSGQTNGDTATRVVLPIIPRPEEDLFEDLFSVSLSKNPVVHIN